MGGERYFAVVGKVAKPHGMGGELKVFSYIGKPENFKKWQKVFVKKGREEGKWFQIQSVRFQHKRILLKLSSVNERNRAELLSGSLLYVQPEKVTDLDENNYPLLQIVGFIVETLSGRKIGVVKDILINPVQNIIFVEKENKEILIPFVKEFVKQIDIDGRKVLISPIEGLLDNAD